MKSIFLKYTLLGLILSSLLNLSCKDKVSKQKIDQFARSNQFADSLISKLNLEEKVSLLHGMGGGDSEFGDLDIPFFGIGGNKQHNIPPLYMGHAITGVRSGRDTTKHATYFKSPIAMGCSWDVDLYAEVGVAIAKEMRALGQDLNVGPTMNIIRHPLGGRNWESYSEDPYLTSRLAVSYVKALQSNGIICGPKHFVANNQETNRFDINNEIDERTLREIYLPAFKASVIEGGALNIMGAFNRVNGSYMCHNKYLLDDVLRGEWGFNGFTFSDFSRGIKDTKEAVDARMNVEMHRPKFYGEPLVKEVKAGNIKEQRIDTLLKDVLRVMHHMNVFTRDRYENQNIIHSAEHIQLSRKVARSSPVLLKNEEKLLPLNTEKITSVAVIGPNAKRFPSINEKHINYANYLQGSGSGRSFYYHNTVVEPYTGFVNAVDKDVTISYAQGCRTPDFFSSDSEHIIDDDKESELIAEAVTIAKKAEIAIVYVGLSGFNEIEGWDRVTANLPGQQEKLIREVSKVNPNTIVVLISGGYVNVAPWVNDVKALLYVPYSGEQIGNGIADIITGKVTPSGKLPFTWPFSVDDYPKSSLFTGGPYSEEKISNVYSDGIFVGYRWFDNKKIDVLYPFGYGLSYTQFNYSDLNILTSTFPIKVEVNVTNSGYVEGAEIVQLYISDPESDIEKAVKELKAFDKIQLKPGESKKVVFELNDQSFSHYDVNQKEWVIDKGEFLIKVGTSSRDIKLIKSVEL